MRLSPRLLSIIAGTAVTAAGCTAVAEASPAEAPIALIAPPAAPVPVMQPIDFYAPPPAPPVEVDTAPELDVENLSREPIAPEPPAQEHVLARHRARRARQQPQPPVTPPTPPIDLIVPACGRG